MWDLMMEEVEEKVMVVKLWKVFGEDGLFVMVWK